VTETRLAGTTVFHCNAFTAACAMSESVRWYSLINRTLRSFATAFTPYTPSATRSAADFAA
jgi:hypothetical protein